MITVNRYKCGHCGACVGVCPANAIELIDTWVEVSEECIECGACAKVCPVGALEILHEG